MSNQESFLFVDCGAPSLFNKLMRQNEEGKRNTLMGLHIKDRTVAKQDYSYVETAAYKKYRMQYIKFIKEHQDKIELFPNLDIINNPQLTWDNQKYLERYGIKPTPVFHLGNDVSWLQRYMDEGYDYICIGGITPETPPNIAPPLDALWENILTDDNGMPKIKVHGFAVTSVRLMTRYPWYSVDSASWVKQAAYGSVLIPVKRNGVYVYDETAKTIFMSTKSTQRKNAGKHYETITGKEREHILKYIEREGFTLGVSEYTAEVPEYETKDDNEILHGIITRGEDKGKMKVEHIVKRGLINDYKERKKLNMDFYCHVMRTQPKWPWAFKLKSTGRMGLHR